MKPLRWAAAIGAIVLRTSAASAQVPAASLEALEGLVAPRTPVTVVGSGGEEVRGTLVDVSAAALVLRSGDRTRRFDAGEIRQVRARREDPLINGALIGAAIGAGLTSLAFLDNECRDDPACYTAVAVYGGLGALAGLGVDALIHGTVVVYAAPMVSRTATGVRLSVAF